MGGGFYCRWTLLRGEPGPRGARMRAGLLWRADALSNARMHALSHLDRLEAESIHILRETVAETARPVMLYSMGKDSAVMLHLARKAFFPGPLPFPLLHVDTTWKFRDMYAMRDKVAAEEGVELIVWRNPEAERQGINPFDHGALHTDMWKTQGLRQALDHHGFAAAFGGARRDEEKSRAKERIFSFRDRNHRWDPKRQRPELWALYNARVGPGEEPLDLLGKSPPRERKRLTMQKPCRQQLAHHGGHASGKMQFAHHESPRRFHVGQLGGPTADRIDVCERE